MILTRRSLLSGLLVTAVATIPAIRILRATEMPSEEHLFTSSWYEQLEKGLWRHQSYAFRALQAPEVLVVNASPAAREIAGVQFDFDDRLTWRIPRKGPEGWIRGEVDVLNAKGHQIELTRDEEQQLIERTRRPTTIIRQQPSDLFGFFEGEGSFV
jgi:hypothetical protein